MSTVSEEGARRWRETGRQGFLSFGVGPPIWCGDIRGFVHKEKSRLRRDIGAPDFDALGMAFAAVGTLT
ncbi:hypothetical protein D1O30_15540 [Methylocystis hirsuta]|uniref:Uncharacterized protein n=1 Tax=Methylocystis hirsuta TaxID=369798 RepID=A0A3M9XR87_9HYPH|nr:hypothetical protein D1O30_15540 [Methylocystis hirsuta]